MLIGLDFDNTIANYDSVFRTVAIKLNLVDKNWVGTKNQLKNYLLTEFNNETIWQKVQGQVYGKYMHLAEIPTGFLYFLSRARIGNHKIVIVSHKTEFGHFDLDKIPLRQVAMDWLKSHFLIGSNCTINETDVFFCNTRQEKIKKINQFNCDFFVDDLLEVLEEAELPNGTKKILYGNNASLNCDFTSTSWYQISDFVFGTMVLDEVKELVQPMINTNIVSLSEVPGKGNSKIYKINTDGNSYAVKFYPDNSVDKRNRLFVESKACELFFNNDFESTLEVLDKNPDLNVGVYKWIDGAKIESITNDDIDQALGFVKSLISLSKKIPVCDLFYASEAFINELDLKTQIEQRYYKLLNSNVNNSELKNYLQREIFPVMSKVFYFDSNTRSVLRNLILSTSDFGFHNAIKDKWGNLHWLDFEYFGWDDAVKLTSDFLWHPAHNLTSNQKQQWVDGMFSLLGDDVDFKNRLKILHPIFGIKWALILLNEFHEEIWIKRKKASEATFNNKSAYLSNQITKSRLILSNLFSPICY